MTSARRTLTSAIDIVDAGLRPEASRHALTEVSRRYAVAITRPVLQLIDHTDAADPIARQFVPDARELVEHESELQDPIGDHAHSPIKGIVHRYPDRVLFKIASVCPVYCRFCFRREMIGPGLGDSLSADEIEAALKYIEGDPNIREVIMTGGDPFVLSARRVREATRQLGSIASVKILRWHTRVPVVDPERVDADLIEALRSSPKHVAVAIHTNHARELSPGGRRAIACLADSGIELLSQTVLLKGVNDDADVLADLMRALVACRVQPYYLHHGDLAPGTAHFRTTIERGKTLMRELETRLTGVRLPKYVLDIPGGHGKVDILTHVSSAGNGTYMVRDPHGGVHLYKDACA